METYFSTNLSSGLVETYVLSSGKNMQYVQRLFSAVRNHDWNQRESILTENYFPASGNHFRFFCQKKQFFRNVFVYFVAEMYFSINASFRVVEMNFLARTKDKLFFRLVETYFLMNPSLKLLETDFLFSGNHLLFLRVIF